MFCFNRRAARVL